MSNSILNNEEVEALLSAIESGQVLVGQKVEPKKGKKVQHYDFRRPDRFPKEQKRRLQKISEEVAKAVGITLSRYLRTSVVIELIAIEEFSYEVFVNSFTDVVCANVVNLKPLNGLGCLTIDVGICLAMVDRGLGGPGKIPQKVRPLTMIEESVVGAVLLNIMEDILKSFYVTRIKAITVKEKKFKSLPVYEGKKELVKMIFRFSPEIASEINDKIWFDEFNISYDENRNILLETKQEISIRLAIWCISWWDKIEILEPKSLLTFINEMINDFRKKNETIDISDRPSVNE